MRRRKDFVQTGSGEVRLSAGGDVTHDSLNLAEDTQTVSRSIMRSVRPNQQVQPGTALGPPGTPPSSVFPVFLRRLTLMKASDWMMLDQHVFMLHQPSVLSMNSTKFIQTFTKRPSHPEVGVGGGGGGRP